MRSPVSLVVAYTKGTKMSRSHKVTLLVPLTSRKGHTKIHIEGISNKPICGRRRLWSLEPWNKLEGTLDDATCATCIKIYNGRNNT